jgi:uncharacterized protein YdhG (YjbR/CyaY superfamily)
MSPSKKFKTVDEYLEDPPEKTKNNLLALRAIILEAAPDATELFNYEMPAYALVKGGKRDKQIMMAGYKSYAGFYVGSGILDHFSKDLAGFKVGKSSVQFPNDIPLPKNLIAKIIDFKNREL